MHTKEDGKAFQARLSTNDLPSAFHPCRQLHQPATSLTTSPPRRHHLPTASTWLTWDRSIYVTVVSLNVLSALSTSTRSTRTTMAATVGIRVPSTLPLVLTSLLLIIQQTITVLCASFIFISLFSRFSRIWHPLHIQSLQQHKQSSTLTTTLPSSLQQP